MLLYFYCYFISAFNAVASSFSSSYSSIQSPQRNVTSLRDSSIPHSPSTKSIDGHSLSEAIQAPEFIPSFNVSALRSSLPQAVGKEATLSEFSVFSIFIASFYLWKYWRFSIR